VTDERTSAARRAFWLGEAQPAFTPDEEELLLPRPPGIIRRFWLRHALAADILIALVGLLVGYGEAIDNGTGLTRHADWLVHGFFVLPLFAAAALLLRRRRPVISLGITVVCSGALLIVNGSQLSVPVALAIYAAAVYSGTLAAWVGAAVAWGVSYCLAIIFHATMFAGPPLLILMLFAVLVGTNIGARRRYLAALIERAGQLARERDQQAQLATAAERARIAREMHDVVAHSLSVMVRLSDGVSAVIETDPDRARTAVGQIGEVGRDALRDMRRLLGVLRNEDAEATDSMGALTPQPSLSDIPHLLETYRSAGLPVAVQWTGQAPSADALQLLIFRVIQEALTNALRYSKEPSRVLVQVDFGAQTTVVVSDDGFLIGPQPSVGSGRGLLGLRERAALFGGTLEAGPLTPNGRGWRLIMTLPQSSEGDR
jgi:signal transduction histidine kinase